MVLGTKQAQAKESGRKGGGGGMHQLQRIGLIGVTVLLLAGFWAGLWYQGRKGGAVVLAAEIGGEAAVEIGETAAGDISGKAQPQERTAATAAAAGDEALLAAGTDRPDSGLAGIEGSLGPSFAGEGEIAVHVVGGVTAPGLYFLPPGSRIYDAVMLAAPESDADLGRINLALLVEDGMQIRVPIIGKASSWGEEALIVRASDNNELWLGGGAAVSQGKVNLNTAAAKELETLPGIGPAYAQRIIQYREEQGGFRTVEDLMKVKGIGQAKMEELRDLVCCS
jgi:competence protein ComEA